MKLTRRHLDKKVAWVTGSSRGIGRAIADQLAQAGSDIALHGTSAFSTRSFNEGESLETVAAEMAERNRVRVIPVNGDLTDLKEVQRIVREMRQELGSIDILVNCAGGDVGSSGIQGPMAGKPENNDAVFISPQDMKTVLDRNLLTCIYCCREVVPGMMERRFGKIVNIGSISGLKGFEKSVIYATAKAAVHEYSRCLAVQLRSYNVSVNVVAPGDTMSERFLASRTIDKTKMLKDGTLDRYGEPVEIARAVEFLVSDAASYISGQVLRVDGGTQCWPA